MERWRMKMADRVYKANGGEVSKADITRMRSELRCEASSRARQRDQENAQARKDISRIRKQRTSS